MANKSIKKPSTKSKRTTKIKESKSSSLLRVVDTKHTGKIIHHKHTSHFVLLMLLALLGLFLFASDSYVRSFSSKSSSLVVGAIIAGEAPKTSAVIKAPADGAQFDKDTVDVSGVCEKNSFVIIHNNNVIAGTAPCSEAGVFSLQIQLTVGKNVLTSLNYDNLNQVGPVSSTVTVYLRQNGSFSSTVTPSTLSSTLQTLLVNPTIISGLKTDFNCENYSIGELPESTEPRITVACMPRLFLPEMTQVMGVLVWGGKPPYALSVDKGDGSNDIVSIAKAGYKTLQLNYTVPNIYKVDFKLKDHSGKTAIIQTSVQISGVVEGVGSALNTDDENNPSTGGLLVEAVSNAPATMYLTAVAVVVGFWCGDLFDRKYGAKKPHSRKSKTV